MKSTPQYPSPEVLDLLPTLPSRKSFDERISILDLSSGLYAKVAQYSPDSSLSRDKIWKDKIIMTRKDEKELGGEVLLRRHKFTELILHSTFFKQAALTVIQNIYLFQNRHIFFDRGGLSTEEERQKALTVFSSTQLKEVPLSDTLQHLIIARTWHRIISQMENDQHHDAVFIRLHQIVEELNTLRNIYMLLSTHLVNYLVSKMNSAYNQSLMREDAIQIGLIGVARAAYRYHPCCGVRFSTFSANWVFREIQRQALSGRLIRLSSNIFDKLSIAARIGDSKNQQTIEETLNRSTPQQLFDLELEKYHGSSISTEAQLESKQLSAFLLALIDSLLSPINAEIIKRRYGFPPFHGQEETVVEISKHFGCTRSSIYQREKVALALLRNHLPNEFLTQQQSDFSFSR